MKFQISFFSLLLFFSQSIWANPIVEPLNANIETTPLPTGYEESDDAAIWVNPHNDSQSLVLGVNKAKIKHGGNAGVGVYDLNGKELQYFSHDRLNNIDLRYNVLGSGKDIAAASNRDKNAISLFSVNAMGIKLLADLPTHIAEEPYGLCMQQEPQAKRTFVWLPMKSGMLYQFELVQSNKGKALEAKLRRSIDTATLLTKAQDQHLINIIIEDVFLDPDTLADELKDEVMEEVSERHQLEGCVADDENDVLYFGMENLGVWKLPLQKGAKASLILQVEKSKFVADVKHGPWKSARATNDIEGITLYKTNAQSKGALIISVQGLDEFAVLDRIDHQYLGSFSVSYGSDAITETDGLTVSSKPMGNYPFGLMVMHDHHNTDASGKLLKANYKYMDMAQFLAIWPSFTP